LVCWLAVTTAPQQCPRCQHELPSEPGGRFCPRCGLRDYALVRPDLPDAPPLTLNVDGIRVVVGRRFTLGDTCNLYHCHIGPSGQPGVFKIARSFYGNGAVQAGHETLKRLVALDTDGRAAPFLPIPVAMTTYKSVEALPGRVASILAYHDSIASPEELYSLAEVWAAYPAGVDAKHLAWIWRRLLTVLGFAHASRVMHCAVRPEHVLIEPRDHKLVLIGWSSAVAITDAGTSPGVAIEPFRTDIAAASGAIRSLAAPGLDPALVRYFDRAQSSQSVDASKLLGDFDRLIDALWGPRTFVPFHMPSRDTFRLV
jgi:hypothetical protein